MLVKIRYGDGNAAKATESNLKQPEVPKMAANSSLVKKNTHKKYRDPPPPAYYVALGTKFPKYFGPFGNGDGPWGGTAFGVVLFVRQPSSGSHGLTSGTDWADSPVGRAALAWDGVNAPLARQGG